MYIYIVYYLPTTHRLVVYTDLCYSGVVVVYMGETVYVYISEYMAGSYCYLCEGLLQKTFSMHTNIITTPLTYISDVGFLRKSFTWKRWKRNRKRWKRWKRRNYYIWCWKRWKRCNHGHGCTIKKHRDSPGVSFLVFFGSSSDSLGFPRDSPGALLLFFGLLGILSFSESRRLLLQLWM